MSKKLEIMQEVASNPSGFAYRYMEMEARIAELENRNQFLEKEHHLHIQKSKDLCEWMTYAHVLCTDLDVPHGHIQQRLMQALVKLDDLKRSAKGFAPIQRKSYLQSASVSEKTRKTLEEIASERGRQIEQGFTSEHDKEKFHTGELSSSAAAYALNAACVLYPSIGVPFTEPPSFFTWHHRHWKPKTPREDLIKASALILAEIERMD